MIWLVQEELEKIDHLEKQVASLEKKAVGQKREQERRNWIWNRARTRDLQHTFSPFLTPELKRVQALCRHYPDNRPLHERLQFLQGEENRIRWTVSVQREESSFHEKEFKMETAVQMNDDDLKKFLIAVEGDEAPLLIMKEFHLSREQEKADEIVYHIQAEIIHRSS